MSISWVISGTRYEPQNVSGIGLIELKEIKRQTGLTPRRLEECYRDLVELGDEGAAFSDLADMLGSDDHLDMFTVMIWLARRRAGESLTIREAADFPMDEFLIEGADDEPELPVEAEDPQ